MTADDQLVIGTRGSPLALAQAYETRQRLVAAHGLLEENIRIEVIQTRGDQIQDKALRAFGGKGLFTKEIEEALLGGRVDVAVHSMKDVQTRLPEGLQIAAILPRADVRDAFISPVAASIDELPQGAVVGTSSLRRQAQLLNKRPDLEVVTFRGSVETRLSKLARGEVAATFLAVAGLDRLGLSEEITAKISVEDMLPAVAQGAIGIECRAGDERVGSLVAGLNDPVSAYRVTAERAFLAKLDGSCRTPIAGLASLDGEVLSFKGEILAPDGSKVFRGEASGPVAEAGEIGEAVASRLISEAGADFLAAMVD